MNCLVLSNKMVVLVFFLQQKQLCSLILLFFPNEVRIRLNGIAVVYLSKFLRFLTISPNW